HSGERAVEQRLLGEEPADHAVGRRRARSAERSDLCPGAGERTRRQQQNGDEHDGCEAAHPRRRGTIGHGHFTQIRLAKLAPMPIFASELAKALLSRSVAGKLSSRGFSTEAWHAAGALTSRTGSRSAKPKSMKNSGS